MKNKKMVLWIALVVMAIIPVYAQQYDSEKDFQIDWDENVKNGVIIAKYVGAKKEVRIPPSIQNNPVTGIGSQAFLRNGNITRVIIPNSVTSIGLHAFYGCSSLTSVTIPNSVTSIGIGVFRDCTSLTSITIPDSVTSIDGNLSLYYGGAFQGCTALTSVTIPNSVTSIGDGAFQSCTSLTSVTIPNSVTSIGDGAFWGCTNLTSVTFQGKIYSNKFGKSYSPFNGNLSDMYLASDGGPGTYKRFAGGDVWKKTQSISQPATPAQGTTQQPATTTTSAVSATGTPGLKYDYLPNNNKELAVSAGTARGAVVIPATYNNLPVTMINSYGFTIDGITDITIPNSVTRIERQAFCRCTNLTSVIIPNSVTDIEQEAFLECRSLTSVTIPNSVTSIGDNAFDGCTSLTSVTFECTISKSWLLGIFNSAFPGDLRAKYLKGGIGTYTRPNGKSTKWTKQ